MSMFRNGLKAEMFEPSRLTLARLRRGLSKTALAERIGVSVRSVTAYEDGDYEPSVDVQKSLSLALGFPRGFFEGGRAHIPSQDAASFRSLSKKTAVQRDMALATGGLALHLSDWIERRFRLPPPNLVDIEIADPEAAAMMVRQKFGVGELPIRSVLQLLEAHGVRIFALGDIASEIDAFSIWHGNTPYVFVNTTKTAERGRFDLAHELGHLILHRHGSPEGRLAEDEANAFASAFLMPMGSLTATMPTLLTLPRLMSLKRHWGVSAMAMAYRLNRIGCLSEWHYRSLYVELAKLGYRVGEPDGRPRETSALLEKVLTMLRQQGIGLAQLAAEVSFGSREIEGLLRGLTPVGIEGEGGRAQAATRAGSYLSVVK